METLLTTTKLTKIFSPGLPTEVRAVRAVDFTLRCGEIVMIMGPSGSGKTTLLTMLGGLLRPTSGTIAFRGEEIEHFSSGRLTRLRREHIGFIFQSFNLLETLTAWENVSIGAFRGTDRRGRARNLLDRLGLGQRLNARPKELSGGERQRVAIARALINDPDLILADEPTANLDRAIGHGVMQLLCSIGCEEGKSVVIVSHDERIKDVAHRVISIEDGRLTSEEPGDHDRTCTMKAHHRAIKRRQQ